MGGDALIFALGVLGDVSLILLAALFLACSYTGLSTAAATLLELVKYVTGDVIGSLFGKAEKPA